MECYSKMECPLKWNVAQNGMSLKMECHSKWPCTYLPTYKQQTAVTVVSSKTNPQNSTTKITQPLNFFSQYFWKEQHDTFDN